MDVKTMCLGVLSIREATGYEIKKRLEGPFRHFYQASFGAIYPALARLLKGGLVSVREQAQDGKPDKKIYTLSEAGRAALLEELSRPPGADKIRSEFLAQMVFVELLADDLVAERIEARLAHYETNLEKLGGIDADRLPPGPRFAVGYGLAVYRAGNDYLRANRHLLEEASRSSTARDAAE